MTFVGVPEVMQRPLEVLPTPIEGRNAVDLVAQAPTRIAKAGFGAAYMQLCQRFGRDPDRAEAEAFLGFLEAMGVPEAEAIAGARALWATARFFPRPADFLLLRAEGEWGQIVELARADPPTGTTDEQNVELAARWGTVSDSARKVLRSLGGPSAVRNTRDLARLRRDFIDVYERSVAHDAALRLTQ